ncbi:KDO2-lipid IV(A) lauroyltransferase [Volucribacter psittacicida]|uniref:Lipid A biosynthesis acyltransferase n=1 Tax=Volucribacter psittacicida TaxID=203482 RepID=A0A4R1FRY4_9PAST|nr:LpxL/LpxP family Kdo(2)-lipid IV(A) lauroyl/palmitoleoyl acyltransferase [Volucribacter psittacicida]TCJ96249.1 KDO2-lipid IV(A) lauroyltransferase [Volucribacter psittacicida]
MSNLKNKLLTFRWTFLKPKYWGLWLALALWRLLLLLPYPLLLKVGQGLGWLFAHLKVGKRRQQIARRNLQLCFPDYSPQQIEQILQENLKATGMAIIETGMAWFWSDKRIKKWSKIEGLEHLNKQDQQGIIFVGVHFLTLELGARIVGIAHSGVGVYRPNDNPLLDWLQMRGRLRSNKAMLDRKDLRGMMKALRRGETIWYAPDHDYGRRNAVFVPFFAVPDACTTTGSYYLLKAAPQAKVVPFAPLRNADGSGYTVSISPPVDFSDLNDEVAVATRMNQVVEQEISKGISQYMWLHRRFKTRPEQDSPDLYQNK